MLPRARTISLITLLALIGIAVLIPAAIPPAYAQGGDPPTPAPIPPAARLNGLRHEYQTWCNCGPVNLMMALSYYGWPGDQTVTAAWLKPTVEDKNVSPHEMTAYVHQQPDLAHLRALWRYGGDLTALKRLIAAGFPVIVESGFQPEGHEWMGHYITVVAYDDAVSTIWTYDSYNGYGIGYGEETDYAQFEAWWAHFNRVLIVVYPADREADVMRALGPLADPAAANARALELAQAGIAADPGDGWAWLGAGTSAAALGDTEAAARYVDTARRVGLPFRALWYQFAPYEAYYHAGRYHDVLALADETIAATGDCIEEMNLYRGLALAALGRPAEALAAFDHAIQFNPNAAAPREARALVESGAYVAPAPLRVVAPFVP
ncbi:MAG: C39 family peptidase [Anaerolineae bacterium]|nr:C39 family peptidase [Anaerolineae bacterium]